MRAMKRHGFKELFLIACLVLVAAQAKAQSGSGKVVIAPFAINAVDALRSVQSSLPKLLADKLSSQGVAAVASGDKGEIRAVLDEAGFMGRRLELRGGELYARNETSRL